MARGPHKDLSNLSRFEIDSDDGAISAAGFVSDARERHRRDFPRSDSTPLKGEEGASPEAVPPENFRPAGQTGLDQF